MFMGRPEPVTLVLLVILAMVYLAGDVFLSGELQEKFLLWAGNSSATIQQGEWWRVFTALFLHANWLHLTMNGAGLWIFGTGGGENDGALALARGVPVGRRPRQSGQRVRAHYDVGHRRERRNLLA